MGRFCCCGFVGWWGAKAFLALAHHTPAVGGKKVEAFAWRRRTTKHDGREC